MTPVLPWTVETSKHPLVSPQVKDIATEIYRRITSQRYAFGTRIPAERDLSTEFGVTRATIRQALEFLGVYGIVARRAGSGTFVTFDAAASVKSSDQPSTSGLSIEQLAETTSPFAICIAGSVLEPEIVRLATIYMSTRDVSDLRRLLADLEAIVTEADRFAQIEDEFMMTIARGTHNAIIVAMYSVLHQVRRHPLAAAPRRQTLTPAKIRSIQKVLRSLFEAIETRNVETAVELITLHVSTKHEEMIYESL
ncbi:MAG: FadR family transcriptional regulator [Hyphomicrobium sp.]|nr:FadR family transcriptional regulator [Hyphomicrobium sp.]